MKIGIIVCVHGTEPFGLKVIKELKKLHVKDLEYVVANKKALVEGKRFIDSDLNRSFPGSPESEDYEERLAHKLLQKIENFDIIIDLHSTSSDCPPIAIITKKTKKNIKTAKQTGIKRICFMNQDLASGKSLIDHVDCGVSLEVGNHKDEKIVIQAVNFIKNLLISKGLIEGKKEKVNHEFYEVFGLEKDMNLKLESFKKHKNYYPVLVDEESYTDIKCLKARKIV